jgi:hypothetical protein
MIDFLEAFAVLLLYGVVRGFSNDCRAQARKLRRKGRQ